MAKKYNRNKTLRVKQRKAFIGPGVSLDEPAVCWAKLVNDPCNAPICESPYAGQKGYVTRLCGSQTITVGAGNTAAALFVTPSGCYFASTATATSATTFTPAFNSGAFPGNGFLANNSDQVRCLAGCVQVWSSLSPLNITGNVHAGVINTNTVNRAGISVDALSFLASNSGKMTAEMVELKWRPGSVDEEYNPVGNPPDGSDTNTLFMAFSGLQPTEVLQVKLTFIYEWIPKVNLGLAQSPSRDVFTKVRVPNILAEMDRVMPNWWHHSVRALGNVATGFAGQLVKKAAVNLPLALLA